MISDLITQLYVIRKVNMKYIKCKMKWSGAGRGRKNINTLCVCELLIINCLWCLLSSAGRVQASLDYTESCKDSSGSVVSGDSSVLEEDT